jgi:hypothetical protein
MTKDEITTALTAALDLLDTAVATARPTKADRESWEGFVTTTRADLTRSPAATDGTPRPMIWRIGTATNPTTGREVTLDLKKEGILLPTDAKRIGVERLDRWDEVRAVSRVEALQKIAAGEGQAFVNPTAPKAEGTGKARKPRKAAPAAETPAADA